MMTISIASYLRGVSGGALILRPPQSMLLASATQASIQWPWSRAAASNVLCSIPYHVWEAGPCQHNGTFLSAVASGNAVLSRVVQYYRRLQLPRYWDVDADWDVPHDFHLLLIVWPRICRVGGAIKMWAFSIHTSHRRWHHGTKPTIACIPNTKKLRWEEFAGLYIHCWAGMMTSAFWACGLKTGTSIILILSRSGTFLHYRMLSGWQCHTVTRLGFPPLPRVWEKVFLFG